MVVGGEEERRRVGVEGEVGDIVDSREGGGKGERLLLGGGMCVEGSEEGVCWLVGG